MVKVETRELDELAAAASADAAPRLVQPLFEGPLDVVGDVHGDLPGLKALMQRMGYAPSGIHPEKRRLVFVGDLVDRGPDSPGVLALVERLIDEGRAQCVLGNHELSLLRGKPGAGNAWFYGHDVKPKLDTHTFNEFKNATAEQRERALRFFARLPLALERADLRVVHAEWSDDAIAAARAWTGGACALLAHHEPDDKARQCAALDVDPVAYAEEHRTYEVERKEPATPMAAKPHVAAYQERRAQRSAVRRLTSGSERAVAVPFYSHHEWRVCQRIAWWNEYRGPAVVVGHYWRPLDLGRVGTDQGAAPGTADAVAADLFDAHGPDAWLGNGHAFCVDFGAGRRNAKPALPAREGAPPAVLAALRWPDNELWFDDRDPVRSLRGLA